MGTWVVCTRLQVAPDGVSSKTRSALPLTLKTSTGGASTVGGVAGKGESRRSGGRRRQGGPGSATWSHFEDGPLGFRPADEHGDPPVRSDGAGADRVGARHGKRGRHGPAGIISRPRDFERLMPCPAHGGEQRRRPAGCLQPQDARRSSPTPGGQGGARQVPRPVGLAEQAHPSHHARSRRRRAERRPPRTPPQRSPRHHRRAQPCGARRSRPAAPRNQGSWPRPRPCRRA